jgi:alpha-L-fucosidase
MRSQLPLLACLFTLLSFASLRGDENQPKVLISPNVEPMQTGKFEPNWKSLEQYETPKWYRDAKFGIWAHWGPQCEPEQGDWYARHMYIEGHGQANFHREHYGHPSKFGFKDVINEWKAENWNPEKLMALYKRAGAQYFVALANHCDNFDNYESKYQPWNSVNMGPKKDLIGGWHYDINVFNNHRYKSAKTVIHTLCDVVSKNGNLLLSVPVRADGTIDSDEVSIVKDITAWMDINGESIFGTRPWKVFGEGPAIASAVNLSAQGFNEGKGKPFTAEDIRFTKKGDILYAIVLGKPEEALKIVSLGKNAGLLDKPISKIQLLGSDEELKWEQEQDALIIECPHKIPSNAAIAFKIQ